MRAYDIIKKKRDGEELSNDEINFFVSGYNQKRIPDEQAAAFLMAVYFKGMSRRETFDFTNAIVATGEIADLSGISGVKVDKHSTGGVGDKTTLVVIPIVAACGVKAAKLSGRGLGHTGGTIDKLESIPGYRTSLSRADFQAVVNEVGAGVAGQSAELAPADKRLYALRDVTATVEVPALIAASIMSKKLASGADKILLDVKVGSGAFNKTEQQGRLLARLMVDIGSSAGKQTVALLTDMDAPLGNAIGNSLELIEAIETLKGNGPEDLIGVCLALASEMLYLADSGDRDKCGLMAKEALYSGAALDRFSRMIAAQGGDSACCIDSSRLPVARYKCEFIADKSGYITGVDCEGYGRAALELGAGRNRKEDSIDHGAGLILKKKTGDYVISGDTIAVLYSSAAEFDGALSILRASTYIGDKMPEKRKMIIDRIE